MAQVAEHVARRRLDDPIRHPQEAFAIVPIQQSADPVPHAGLVDQAEVRQDDDRDGERDGLEGRDSDVSDTGRNRAHAAGDVARVRPERLERAAPVVDEAAELALPDLVEDLRDVAAERLHRAAGRLHHHEQHHPGDEHDPEHQHEGARAAAEARPAFDPGHDGREDGDAEQRHEEHEQDVRDGIHRPRERHRACNQQHRADRDRDLERGAGGRAIGAAVRVAGVVTRRNVRGAVAVVHADQLRTSSTWTRSPSVRLSRLRSTASDTGTPTRTPSAMSSSVPPAVSA